MKILKTIYNYFLKLLIKKDFNYFEKKYGILSQIKQCDRKLFHYHITENHNYLVSTYDSYDTYDEAKKQCLKKLIEIVKQNKNG